MRQGGLLLSPTACSPGLARHGCGAVPAAHVQGGQGIHGARHTRCIMEKDGRERKGACSFDKVH